MYDGYRHNSTANNLLSSSKPVGLASRVWLVWTVPCLDTASGHEPTLYALVMNTDDPSVADNGDRPCARTRRFLQQD